MKSETLWQAIVVFVKKPTITAALIIVVGLLAYIISVRFTLGWYEASYEHLVQYNPGSFADSLNTVTSALTLLVVVAAYLAYRSSQSQVDLMRIDNERRLISEALDSAIGDFKSRLGEKEVGNCFIIPMALVTDQRIILNEHHSESKQAIRNANYVLKPLSYWCKWVNVYGYEKSVEHEHTMEASALRILSAMRSEQQVYLYLAITLKLEEGLSVTLSKESNKPYPMYFREHLRVGGFIERHAPYEWEMIKTGNPSQTARIDAMAEKAVELRKQGESVRYF